MNTINEFEALKNAVNNHELTALNLSIYEKIFEDKRRTTKKFFLHNNITGETISPILDYEQMNHFINGFAKAKNMFYS